MIVPLCNKTSILILAAGQGSRLLAPDAGQIKPLVRVHGRPLIEYALLFAEQLAGDERIFVVGGPEFALFEAHRRTSHINYTLLQNTQRSTGNLVSLLCGLESLDGPLIVLNADHIYPLNRTKTFLSLCNDSIVAFCDRNRRLGPDDMKVDATSICTIKQISKKLQRWNRGYIGITYIPISFRQLYAAVAQQVLQARGNSAAIEEVLQTLADRNIAIHCPIIDEIKWFEVDTAEDLGTADEAVGLNPRLYGV